MVGKKRKVKNPLGKRLPRELRAEFGKYLVIFLLLAGTIGFVSGFLVADGSMIIAYNESFSKYNIEDGNFTVSKKCNKAQLKAMDSFGITVYEKFYVDEALENGSTLRIYKERKAVNRACLMEGRMPETTGEIAVDRMYADNNAIRPGTVLTSAAGEQSWTVTGLVALSDYSCLFSDNSDSMFDSVKFGVAVVCAEEFANLDKKGLIWQYAWKYQEPVKDEEEERERSEDLLQDLLTQVSLDDFIPRYQNQAIQFTGEDMGSDKAMMLMLLYIVIGIMAFVFALTVSGTIAKESSVIGVLRASGYTRGELTRHYMAMPVLVTFAAAIAGNLLGYTVMKDVCAAMYYGSYSLPTYVTVWNAEAFVLTTVVPILLMFAVNLLILHRKLKKTPLQFLRRQISGKKRGGCLPLPAWIPFFLRFRLRVIFQNLGGYVVLFIGIIFANLMLMFGLLFPAVLKNYQEELEGNLLCSHQYFLEVPLNAMNEERKLSSLVSLMLFRHETETENEDAEQFSAYSLKTLEGPYKSEEVLLYGVKEGSRYIPIEAEGDGVYISRAYEEKFGIEPGDVITLKEAYEEEYYDFSVAGIYDYSGALALFMRQDALNERFDLGKDYFSGYLSDSEITDIDRKYIGSVVDLEALTKISRQLNVSMGGMMSLVDGFSLLMFMVVIYLLAKLIIEKNAGAISMTKILGYKNGEISGLYLLPTTVVALSCMALSLPIEARIMEILFRTVMMDSITGWISFYIDPEIYAEMFLMGAAVYGVVAFLEYRKIRRVPMDEALKDRE